MALVSIILPTYNRARFLTEAFEAIRNQQFSDWELIVVDDGSTDNTRELVDNLARSISQPVLYIYQENQGAYGARNTGLDHAAGKYFAFYDSDDLWLPHHLADCVTALEHNPDVDWVYGACQIVDHAMGKEIEPSTFYVNGKPRPFLRLKTQQVGRLRVIVDGRATERVLDGAGLMCGLQNSVLRQHVFENARFVFDYRNEAEDRLWVIRSLAAKHRLAYLDAVHVIYRVHDDNSSASSRGLAAEKKSRLMRALIRGYEELPGRVNLSRREMRALRRLLSREYFWGLGYSALWMYGRRQEALAMFKKGISFYPYNGWYWKTYFLSWLRCTLGRREFKSA